VPRANGARVARNLGRLVSLTSVTDKIAFASVPSVGTRTNGAAAGSIVCWFRKRYPAAIVNGRIFHYGSTTNSVSLFEGANVNACQLVMTRGGVNLVSTLINLTPAPGEMMCAVVTWDATSVRVYGNGVLVFEQAIDGRPDMAASTVALNVGCYPTTNNTLTGDVGGELYVYDRKLARGEVERHYFDAEVPEAPAAGWGPNGWPTNPSGTAHVGTAIALTHGTGSAGVITGGISMNEPAEQRPARSTHRRAGARFQQVTAGTSVGGWVIADHATLRPAVFSIEARVRCDAWAAGTLGVNGTGASNYRGIIVKTSVVNWNDGWGLIEVANAPTGQKNLRLFVGSYSNGTTFLVSPHTKELHVLATYDGATARMYVDGELVSTWAAGAVAQVAQPIRIGHGYAAGSSGGYALEGSVRDVRYYSRVLSDVEARARFQDDIDAPGMIAAWDLRESRRQSTYNNIVGAVARDRVSGFDAVWTNGTYGADADDLAVRRAPRRARVERVNVPWLSGSARSPLDASMAVGTGSFSVAGTFLIHSWNANTNNLITASDDASYANGWVLVYTPISEASATLVGYVGSAGPNAYGTTAGRVTIQRGKRFRLAFVADAVTGKASWYVDGVRLSEVAVAAWNLPNTPRFCVGLSIAIASATGMRAADVRYAVGRAWTREEIDADAAGVEDALSGVTHAWPMDDLPGSTSLRATKGSSALSTLGGGAGVEAEALANDYTEAPRVQALGAASAFSNSQWFKSNLTFSGAVAGPDGVTLDAENVTEDSATSTKQAYANIGSEKATHARYVFSVDVAPSGRTWVALSTGAGAAFQWFDLSTGTVGARSGTAIVDAWMVPRGNGYYRCTVVTNQNWFAIFAASANSVVSYLGDGRVALKTANVQVTRLSAVSRSLGAASGVALAPAANVPYDVGPPDQRSSAFSRGAGLTIVNSSAVNGCYVNNVAVTTDFTVRFRFRCRLPSVTTVDRVFGLGEYPNGILITHEPGNRLGVYWKTQNWPVTALVEINREVDVCVAFNRALKRCRVFIDGVLKSDNTVASALTDTAALPFAIGSSGAQTTAGTYRDVRAYARELTEGEALALYRGQDVHGAFINWPLDDGAGTTARDLAGGNSGTLMGGANVVWTRD